MICFAFDTICSCPVNGFRSVNCFILTTWDFCLWQQNVYNIVCKSMDDLLWTNLRVNEVNLSRFEVGGSRGFWEMEFLEHVNNLFLFLMAIMNFIHHNHHYWFCKKMQLNKENLSFRIIWILFTSAIVSQATDTIMQKKSDWDLRTSQHERYQIAVLMVM